MNIQKGKGILIMAINIQHVHKCQVHIHFYSFETYIITTEDHGTIDEIAERISEFLVKHDFRCADVYSNETGEILMTLERT